jgi:hypothetical protein
MTNFEDEVLAIPDMQCDWRLGIRDVPDFMNLLTAGSPKPAQPESDNSYHVKNRAFSNKKKVPAAPARIQALGSKVE